jgi:hypothetical protein
MRRIVTINVFCGERRSLLRAAFIVRTEAQRLIAGHQTGPNGPETLLAVRRLLDRIAPSLLI